MSKKTAYRQEDITDETEILVGDFDGKNFEVMPKNLRVIKGYADFRNSNITDLGKLENIEGDTYFRNSNITSLKKLNIGGDADFRNSKITSLNLKKLNIGGSAWF